MSNEVSRRKFLSRSFGALVGTAMLANRGFAEPPYFLPQAEAAPASTATTIRATKRTFDINGKAAPDSACCNQMGHKA